MISRLNRLNTRALLAACVVLQTVVFLVVAFYRLVDLDEGFYLLASKLVYAGRVPYRDFFFPQAPGLPYVYGLWMLATGASWWSARMLSGLLSMGLGVCLFRHLLALYRQPALAVAGALLYLANAMVLAWHTVAKTYALADLLLFGAYLQVFAQRDSPSGRRSFGTGLLVALAVDVRLYLAAAAPLLLWQVYRDARRAGSPRRSLAAFLAGLTCGLAPHLILLAVARGAYFFNNLGYHLIRSDSSLLASLRQKLGVVLLLTNLQPAYDALGGQFAMLAALTVLLLAVDRNLDPRLHPAVRLAGLLAFVCLLPRPSHTQYFTVCVPYLIVAAIGFYENARRRLENQLFSRRLFGISAGLFLLAYLGYGAVAVARYAGSGVGVAGIETRDNAPNFRLPAVRQVSAEIDRWNAGQAPVASFWPGYLVECRGAPVPGLENDFGVAITASLAEAKAREYRLLTLPGLDLLLAQRTPQVVVLGNSDYWGADSRHRERLVGNGYRLVSKIGTAEIYVSGGG